MLASIYNDDINLWNINTLLTNKEDAELDDELEGEEEIIEEKTPDLNDDVFRNDEEPNSVLEIF